MARPFLQDVLHRLSAFLLVLLLAGCGGDHGGGGTVERDGDTLHSDHSSLVIEIPAGLPASVSETDLARVYLDAAALPACQKSTGEPVDLLLAEACVDYQKLYLYPEFLPASLDAYATVADYVAALRASDPYTRLFSAPTFQGQVTPTLSGARAAIGILLAIADGAERITSATPLRILQVLPFTPAWYDGLRAGDEILAVRRPPDPTDHSVEGLTLAEALDLLPIVEGEPVVLTVGRAGAHLEIATASELYLMRTLGDGIAYLSVRSYTARTGDQVRELCDAAAASSGDFPITAWILDLRSDGGGSVAGALDLTDYLVDRDLPASANPVVSFEDRDGNRDVRYLGAYRWNLKGLSPANFAVLVNEGTASAAEITVAALRAYGVARVIGTRTLGKGVAQEVEGLLDGSGLFVTSKLVVPPEPLEPYHRIGIEPDQWVDGSVTDGTITQENDPQLAAAIQWLTAGPGPLNRETQRLHTGDSDRRPPPVDPWPALLNAR